MSNLGSARSTSKTLLKIHRGVHNTGRLSHTHRPARSGPVGKYRKKRSEPRRKMYAPTVYNPCLLGGQYVAAPHGYNGRFHCIPRVWENVDHPRAERDEVQIDVMTYNVLSQYLLEQHLNLYEHCDPSYLDFEFRGPMIIAEILNHQPTVVCLQEVDATYFMMYYTYHLAPHGYTGKFYKKTGEDKYDGLAIFYKNSLIKLVGYEQVQYLHPGHPVLDRDNIGLISVFESLQSPRRARFCVATTHLLFNKKRGDVKLAQIAVLIARLYEQAARPDGISPVIVCGDFNSLPYSPLYNFIMDRRICYSRTSSASISGQLPFYQQSPTPILGNILPPWMDHNCLVKAESQPLQSSTNSASSSNLQSSVQGNNIDQSEQTTSQDTNGGQSQQMTTQDINNTSNETDELYRQAFTNLQNPTPLNPYAANAINVNEPWGTLCHPFKLFSCYENEHGRDGGVPGVSTQHSHTRGLAVDHIFYSVGLELKNPDFYSLRHTAKYRMPTAEQLFQYGSLPTNIAPSDHVPLIARFCLK